MTNVVKKVSINGQVVPFGGGGSEGQEVVYLTQAEYDALPSSKLTDGKIYKIKTSGSVPSGGGTAIERGDVLLSKIVLACDVDGYYLSSTGSNYEITLKNNYGLIFNTIQSVSGSAYRYVCPTYHGYLIYYSATSNTSGRLYSYDINNSQLYQYNVGGLNTPKLSGEYVYIKFGTTTAYKRFNLDLTGETDITQEEYDNVANFWGSYNGLFYAQDGTDYVATDINGTEVKRYVGVGTINGIANGKLYRNVGDVAYAIATI